VLLHRLLEVACLLVYDFLVTLLDVLLIVRAQHIDELLQFTNMLLFLVGQEVHPEICRHSGTKHH
jgi:hypothetical protein